ncbi:DUF2284 domain-containing protein [Intestinimonas sp.]|uniref:DUF2284 domain-containing protein n=1 Tax=Intestinimonas sp. TaxID=1965293 RepID=UPI00262C0663|nr:DUF2284 domain-containing protein [Intestinimonas sp.]
MYTTEVRVKSMPVQEWLDHYCFPDLFRDACLHCPDHNMNWSCPPEVPAAAELLGEYRTVHLIGVKVLYGDEQRAAALASPKAADAVRSASYGVVKKALLEVLLNLEQMVPGSYTVAAGRCEQCEKCSRVMGRVCRRPERLRYSFSAFGFDLTGLARDQLGLELLWAKDGLPEYNVALAAFLTR